MRLGVIGTSWISDDFINGCKVHNHLKFTAVYSRNYEVGSAFCKKHQGEIVFTDLDAFAKSENIDCVYIASPNVFHYPQAKLLLESGKHVICEKPVTMNANQLSELYRFSVENRLVFIEAMKPLYIKEREVLKDALRRIGKISTVILDFSQYSSKFKALDGETLPNIFNPAMGTGCLMDLGCYPISLAVDLFGKPLSVTAKAELLSNGIDIAGSAILEFESPNHFYANLTYSKSGQNIIGSQILGEKGSITLTSLTALSNITLYLRNEETGEYEKSVLSGEKQGFEVMKEEAEFFFKLIESQKSSATASFAATEQEKLYQHSKIVQGIMEEIRKDCKINLEILPS